TYVADHAVDDEAGHAVPLRDGADIASGHRHLVVARLDHDDVPSLGEVDRRVEHQVVVLARAHGEGRPGDARHVRPQRADRVAHDAGQVDDVTEIGGRELPEGGEDVGGEPVDRGIEG